MRGKIGFKMMVASALVAAGLGLTGCGTRESDPWAAGGTEGALGGATAKLQSGFHKALPGTSASAAPTPAPRAPTPSALTESPAASGPVDYAEWDRQLDRASATGWMPGRGAPDRAVPTADAARPRDVSIGIPGFEGLRGVSSFGQAP